MVKGSREIKLQHFENEPFSYHFLLNSMAYRQKWAELIGGPSNK